MSSTKPKATGAPVTPATRAAPVSPKRFNQEKLIQTIQTLQFVWFVGHLLNIIGIFFYALTYVRIGAGISHFWYNLSLFGDILTFSVILYQRAAKPGFNFLGLLKDETFHFFNICVIFLILRPYVFLPILPFGVFSVFHCLSYIELAILPIFAIGSDSNVSKKITTFTSQYFNRIMELSSLLEVCSLGLLFLRVLTFRSNSIFPFLAYFVFVKIRFEQSLHTRNYVKTVELQVDDLVNSVHSVQLKQGWVTAKEGLRKVGGIYLVNNYTVPVPVKEQ